MKERQDFEASLRRANRAEDKKNSNFGNHSRGRGRGGRPRGGYRPSVERKGEIKYHNANEQKLKEMSSNGGHGSRGGGNSGDSKKKGKGGGETAVDPYMEERLRRLDEDEYFMI